jgi:hypothetical protein
MTTTASGRLMPAVALALSLAACGGGSPGGDQTAYYTLSVHKGGGGAGTVTGGGGAISCGAACSASFVTGTVVTLTAAPDASSTFGAWTGCDGVNGASCTVTLNADRVVGATFDPGTGSLQVVNSTSYTITELYRSPAGAGTWGTNLLVSSIAPAGTFTLTDVPVGSYDFRAVASDAISYWQTSSVSITDGGLFTWTLLPPEVGSVMVVNNHCIALDQLYLRPPSSPTWSPNQLASPVAPGGTFTLTGLPVGTYDVSAGALDGLSWTSYGIAVTAGGTFTWSVYMPAGTGCLTVVNNGPHTIDYLFDPFSPMGCSSDLWGTERLGGQLILPDTSFTLSNVPQGTHDFWARSVASAVDYRVCAMGIPPGGAFVWYLIPL